MRKKYLLVILIILVFFIIGCSKSNSNIKNYLNIGTPIDSNAKDIMPDLDDLPKYESIAYKYTHKSVLLFESESVALIVNYDDETYEREKNKLAEKYIFLDQSTDINSNESNDIIPEHEFSISSYTFKVVADNDNSNTHFPKSFGMIGTSDKEKSIAYLYFYDADLDSISEGDDDHPMASFVDEYFDYDFK